MPARNGRATKRSTIQALGKLTSQELARRLDAERRKRIATEKRIERMQATYERYLGEAQQRVRDRNAAITQHAEDVNYLAEILGDDSLSATDTCGVIWEAITRMQNGEPARPEAEQSTEAVGRVRRADPV